MDFNYYMVFLLCTTVLLKVHADTDTESLSDRPHAYVLVQKLLPVSIHDDARETGEETNAVDDATDSDNSDKTQRKPKNYEQMDTAEQRYYTPFIRYRTLTGERSRVYRGADRRIYYTPYENRRRYPSLVGYNDDYDRFPTVL